MKWLKGVWCNFSERMKRIFEWVSAHTMRDGNPMTDEKPPYTHCLNCGTELNGLYCHKCGQQAKQPYPKMMQFIKEYLKNVFPIERQAIPTICTLIFHPGHLVKEYCGGRYASYMHPLKLNLFILLILITLFSFSGGTSRVQGSFEQLAHGEAVTSILTLQGVMSDEEYLAQMLESPRDTIDIIMPSSIVSDTSAAAILVDIIEVSGVDEERLNDTMRVVAPTLMITDGLIYYSNGLYRFTHGNKMVDNNSTQLSTLTNFWHKFTSFIINNFPLLMLFTAPLLAHSLRRILRRRQYPKGYFYIFALYFMAFMELLLAVVYTLGMIFNYSLHDVRNLVLLIIYLFLVLALKSTYDIKSWFKTVLAALFVFATYYIVCMFFIILIGVVIFMFTVL